MNKPDNTPYRIYCAGPLFNPSERAEMEMVAETLEAAGFKTFLPHRDGFLYGAVVPAIMKEGYPLNVAQWMTRQAIFALDVQQVLTGCDATVVNLNGRVPDEGAVAEGAIAWTAGKVVVFFKDDVRAPLDGLDNPLVVGLGGFRLVKQIDELPRVLSRALANSPSAPLGLTALPDMVRHMVELGQRIAEALGSGDPAQLVPTIIQLFDEFQGTPKTSMLLHS
jgi:nucleoside 2-deoxyribosyltransferase